MNERDLSEWISAYADGEVAPAERDAVEQRLAESPELRGQLADYQKLSSLLQDLPAPRLGEDLAPAVLRQAERATLLGAQVAPADAAAQPSRSRRKVWWLSGLSVAATAAVVLLVSLSLPQSPQAPSSTGVADRESALSSADDLSVAATERLSFDPRGPMDDKVVTDGVEADSALMSIDNLDAQLGMSNSAMLPGFRPTEAELEELIRYMERPLEVTYGGVAGLQFSENLKAARVGEQFDALRVDSNGNGLVVVRLQVVDRNEGLHDLEILLKELEIPSEQPETEQKSTTADAPTDVSASLYAVYVEADSTQMLQAVEKLQQNDDVTEIQVASSRLAPQSLNYFFREQGYSELPETVPLLGDTTTDGLPAPAAAGAPAELDRNQSLVRGGGDRPAPPPTAIPALGRSEGRGASGRFAVPENRGRPIAGSQEAQWLVRDESRRFRQRVLRLPAEASDEPLAESEGAVTAAKPESPKVVLRKEFATPEPQADRQRMAETAPVTEAEGLVESRVPNVKSVQVLFVLVPGQADPPPAAAPAEKANEDGAS